MSWNSTESEVGRLIIVIMMWYMVVVRTGLGQIGG